MGGVELLNLVVHNYFTRRSRPMKYIPTFNIITRNLFGIKIQHLQINWRYLFKLENLLGFIGI